MRQINELIDANIIKQARLLDEMTASLRSLLPPDIAPHCWVAGYRHSILSIVTDSSSWVLAVRYQQHEIFKLFNTVYRLAANKLKIKVTNPLPQPTKSPIHPTISFNTRKLLESIASTTSDPGLRSALWRLAKRGQPKD